MIGNKRQRLKEAAVHSLRVGKPDEALIAGRHLSEQDPTDAEAYQLQGLALARLGEPDEATAAFREALRLDSTEGKHYYNLASHLANQGQTEEAKTLAAEAVRIAPQHADAVHLLEVLEGRADSTPPVAHLLPWMRNRERLWDRTGYFLMGVAAILAVLMFTNTPAAPTGKKVPKGQLPDVALLPDALSQTVVFLLIASTLSTFVWMLADIVDRRKRFTWIVPVIICGLMGLNIVPFAMYFFVGRKIEEVGVPKA
ncbi:MAG: tetratricopeptide repeat protein [Fimbriimonas sp.]